MRIFRLDISFSCWFSGFRVPLYIFYQECWQTRELLIRGLHKWRSCCSRIRRYNNSRCRDALVGLLEDLQMWDGFPQLLNRQDFWSITLQIKEFCCTFINSRGVKELKLWNFFYYFPVSFSWWWWRRSFWLNCEWWSSVPSIPVTGINCYHEAGMYRKLCISRGLVWCLITDLKQPNVNT